MMMKFTGFPEFERIFESAFNTVEAEKIDTDSEGTTIRLLAPGASKEDIAIGVNARVLTITNNLDEDKKISGFNEAKYRLNSEFEVSGIKAKLENGILEVRCPLTKKSLKELKGVTIEVE